MNIDGISFSHPIINASRCWSMDEPQIQKLSKSNELDIDKINRLWIYINKYFKNIYHLVITGIDNLVFITIIQWCKNSIYNMDYSIRSTYICFYHLSIINLDLSISNVDTKILSL